MNHQTGGFEMRIDRGTTERINRWRTAQPDLPSEAEAVRRLIDVALEADQQSCLKFTEGELLLMHMLCQFLKRLGEGEPEIDPNFVKDALLGGHYWALDETYPGIFDVNVDNKNTRLVVVDVLEMWQEIERSYEELPDAAQKRVRDGGHEPRFPGFDGNDEGKHLAIANFIVNKMEKKWRNFSRFKKRDLNSHWPKIEQYERMLDLYRPMRQNSGRLSAAQIEELVGH